MERKDTEQDTIYKKLITQAVNKAGMEAANLVMMVPKEKRLEFVRQIEELCEETRTKIQILMRESLK